MRLRSVISDCHFAACVAFVSRAVAQTTMDPSIQPESESTPNPMASARAQTADPVGARSPDRAPPALPDAVDAKGPSANAKGTRILLLGAQHGVWRPLHEGFTNSFAATIQTVSLSHREHIIGRQSIAVALGSSNAGFEWDVHWTSALGAGAYTAKPGLLYARLGFETWLSGNSRTGAKLFAPLLELGHVWASSSYQIDLGVRIDIPVMGGLYVSEWSSAYRARPNFGGFWTARVGRVLLDWQLQRRRLEYGDFDVMHLAGMVCAGKFVVLCTKVNEFLLQQGTRPITQVTVAVGLGTLERTE